jgi:beta-galactosidase
VTRSIRTADAQLLIDGVPTIVLCASLFPFRIPREQWAERLQSVKNLGYNAIDVYVPWNFHEVAPGEFSFEDGRDVDHFLTLAARTCLLVLARPGPYICSEYDGGALPAWLGTIDGLRIRQNEPLYLAHVKRWFDQILPILSAHQVHNGGAVALVQIENELDFFACDDPHGYMTALKAMTAEHDITVPVIACAGQGDLQRATGDAAGVIPAANLYPDDDSPYIEDATAYYEQYLRDRGHPLLVTETNRLHRTLKRMLASGATLLGPYLQSSSWNFDYTASTGNWGNPLGFMTSDYDFGGAIAPNGADRADADQGRLLCRLVHALGPRLGAAIPGKAIELTLEPGADALTATPRTLFLAGGGTLTSLTNLSSVAVAGTIETDGDPLPVRLQPESCLLLIADLPLESIGIAGILSAANAELVSLRTDDESAVLAVHAESTAELRLSLPGGSLVGTPAGGLNVRALSDGTFLVEGTPGSVTLRDGAGALLQVHVVQTVTASRPGDLDLSGERASSIAPGLPVETTLVNVMLTPDLLEYEALALATGEVDDQPKPMECHGIYRGGALYTSSLPDVDALGLLLGHAGDILTVKAEGVIPTMTINGGNDLYIGFDETRSFANGAPISVRADVWGHSNFHDERLPSLELGSLRGISSAAVVTKIVDIQHGWELSSPSATLTIGRNPGPYASWGGWSNSIRPEHLVYRRTINLPGGANAAAIRIMDTESVHTITIDGNFVGRITPLSPVLIVTPAIHGRCPALLEVTTTRGFSEALGAIDLLVGSRIPNWSTAGYGVDELTRAARVALTTATDIPLPLHVKPGSASWVHLDLNSVENAATLRQEDIVIRPAGNGLKLTFVHHGHLIGRVWTQDSAPPLTGGRGDLALAPRPWVEADPVISILVEAVGRQPGILRHLVLSHTIDKD